MKKAEIDPTFNLPYEENEIRLKGIIYFAVGLVLLIVVTFGLMWSLLRVLRDYRSENLGQQNPMAMNEKERLPAEPRLQMAPGFGVDTERGRVNLELTYPQSEYRIIREEWDKELEKGQKDQATGSYSVLPIDQAKEKVLEGNPKVKAGSDAAILEQSRMYITDASSGRVLGEKRR